MGFLRRVGAALASGYILVFYSERMFWCPCTRERALSFSSSDIVFLLSQKIRFGGSIALPVAGVRMVRPIRSFTSGGVQYTPC